MKVSPTSLNNSAWQRPQINMSFKLEPASITWENNEPRSNKYNDLYYSREGGLDESRYVFLQANQIEQRIKNRDSDHPFTIVETGFGTGLNFVATLALWNRINGPKPNLYFVSVEKYPLPLESIKAALSAFPEVQNEAEELIRFYPQPIKGPHTLSFNQGKVKLLLLFGDVLEQLPHHHFCADAWYLDGFNPSENKDMWSSSLFQTIAHHSNHDATFSTFTAAGFVRRGLQSKGFVVNKQKGFGQKREMLTGTYTSNSDDNNSYYSENFKKWAINLSCTSTNGRLESPDSGSMFDVIVIGAGLAGLATAKNLADRGYRVLILEKRSDAALGATGQSSLIMYSKLPSVYNREAELIVSSTTFAQHHYASMQAGSPLKTFWEPTGVLQIDWNAAESDRNEKRFQSLELPSEFMNRLGPAQVTELSSLDLKMGGLWFPKNGRLDPKIYAETILSNKSISSQFDCKVNSIDYNEATAVWSATTDKQEYKGRFVVVANAYDALGFQQTKDFPVKQIRGQVSTLKNHQHPAPECILCGNGYLSPNADGSLHVGATYDLDSSLEQATKADHLKNIEKLCEWIPGWGEREKLLSAEYSSSAGIRCTSNDYNPIVGRVPVTGTMLQRFAKLREDRNACDKTKGDYYPNLFVNIAHGSKGIVTTPVAAELIGSLIDKTPCPVKPTQVEMLHPARFLIRRLIRREI